MTRMMPALLLTSTLVAGACLRQGPDPAEARSALPGADAIAIKVPNGMAKTDGVVQQKIGDLATFYVVTRDISGGLNAGAAFVLLTVRAVTLFQPTSVEGDTLIWGPWTESLKPSEYRLTATQKLDGDWAWSLEGRKKGTSDPYQAVISGIATPGHPGRGSGSFMIDFDTAKALDPVSTAVGQISVTYDLESDPRSVVMDYEHQVTQPDGSQQLGTFHYSYAETTAGVGDFHFRVYGANTDPNLSWKNLLIHSRWLGTGAGRSDVGIAAATDTTLIYATASECWDTSFLRSYYTDSASYNPTEGDPASCAFATAVLPKQE